MWAKDFVKNYVNWEMQDIDESPVEIEATSIIDAEPKRSTWIFAKWLMTVGIILMWTTIWLWVTMNTQDTYAEMWIERVRAERNYMHSKCEKECIEKWSTQKCMNMCHAQRLEYDAIVMRMK